MQRLLAPVFLASLKKNSEDDFLSFEGKVVVPILGLKGSNSFHLSGDNVVDLTGLSEVMIQAGLY